MIVKAVIEVVTKNKKRIKNSRSVTLEQTRLGVRILTKMSKT